MLYYSILTLSLTFFFFFNDTATTEIYTLSLHDALPIYPHRRCFLHPRQAPGISNRDAIAVLADCADTDRKSTRLNSSHGYISYAVFCLKKKKKNIIQLYTLTTICHSDHIVT